MGIFAQLRSLWGLWATERRESARPAAPGGAPPATDEDVDGVIDDLEESISAAIDAVTGPGDTRPGNVRHDYDDRASRELFASIAGNYSRPVKNFIHELKRGSASKEWIDICQPVMGSIIHGAESLGLDTVAKRMLDFREALALARSGEDRNFDAESRDLILSCYEGLVEVLPATFRLADEDRRRESILIHSLLRQVPDVGTVTLEKIYGAGLTTLDALLLATEEDLATATGVPDWLCARICAKVREHRERLEATSPETAQFDQHARLVALVRELRRQQESFQRVSDDQHTSRELAAAKRECLRARQACALQINVLLAEMDEISLVEQLRKMAVERRIERLERYLAAAAVGPAALAQVAGANPQHPARGR